MSPTLKLYIKTFLLTGIPFALLMRVWDTLLGFEHSIYTYIFHCIFFGGFMSATLVSWHIKALKKLGIHDFNASTLNPIQCKAIQSHLHPEEMLSIFKTDHELNKMHVRQTEHEILLEAPITWKSWGERITIRRKAVHAGYKEYELVSRPRLKTTYIDFGKNFQNIMKIEKLITNVT
jgi:hypothetical protein